MPSNAKKKSNQHGYMINRNSADATSSSFLCRYRMKSHLQTDMCRLESSQSITIFPSSNKQLYCYLSCKPPADALGLWQDPRKSRLAKIDNFWRKTPLLSFPNTLEKIIHTHHQAPTSLFVRPTYPSTAPNQRAPLWRRASPITRHHHT